MVSYLLRCGEKGVTGVADITATPHTGEGEGIGPLAVAIERGHLAVVALIEAELERRGLSGGTEAEDEEGEAEKGGEGGEGGGGLGDGEGVEGLQAEVENLPDDELLNVDG